MRTEERIISTGTGWKVTEEAIKDFAARGLLWLQGLQADAESGQAQADQQKPVASNQKLENETGGDDNVGDHSPLTPPSFAGAGRFEN